MTSPFRPHDIPGGLVLASRSPRRHDILSGLGYTYSVEPAPEAVEEMPAGVDVHEIPEVLARRKCDAVAASHPGATVIAADTVVIVDGEILNKPADDAEAVAFIQRLAGRTHTVVTGVAVTRDARHLSGAERTEVTFRELTRREIEAYVATGEGRDKAGSYAAQGVGAGLIRRIDGCFYNVVGLPVALTLELLREVDE